MELKKIMSEDSVEAMLSEAGVKWNSGHIIFWDLKQLHGKSLLVSEKKWRTYFGGNDFALSVDWMVLEDKSIFP